MRRARLVLFFIDFEETHKRYPSVDDKHDTYEASAKRIMHTLQTSLDWFHLDEVKLYIPGQKPKSYHARDDAFIGGN